MAAAASALLQMALALLLTVQGNITATQAEKEHAITVANQAIELATQVLSSKTSSASVPATSLSIVLAPAKTGFHLSVSKNPKYDDQNINAGASFAKIGSFVLGSSSSSTIDISSLNVRVGSNANYLRNLTLQIGSTQVDTVRSMVSSNFIYNFNGSMSIADHGSLTVDVYADILSAGSGVMNPAVYLAGCTGKVEDTNEQVFCDSTAGQIMAVSPAPSPFLSAAKNTGLLDQSVFPGATGVLIASFTLSAASSSVVNLNGLTVQTGPNAKGLQNLSFKISGGNTLGNPQIFVAPDSSYSVPGPIVVPAGGSQNIDVYADVTSNATGTMKSVVSLTDCSGSVATLWIAASCNPVAGQTLSVISAENAFTATLNTSFKDETITASSTANQIAAFALSASSASSVNLTSLSLQINSAGSQLQNLTVKLAGAQYGAVQTSVANGATYIFSGSGNVGTLQNLDIYADTLPGALSPSSPIIVLSACTGTIVQNGGSISCSPVIGQKVAITN